MQVASARKNKEPHPDPPRFPLAHYSAAAAGQQTVIFSMLAAVTLYRALAHPEWIVSTLAFVFYSIIGCLCFFSFAPASLISASTFLSPTPPI